jgi:hypothetical protein
MDRQVPLLAGKPPPGRRLRPRGGADAPGGTGGGGIGGVTPRAFVLLVLVSLALLRFVCSWIFGDVWGGGSVGLHRLNPVDP